MEKALCSDCQAQLANASDRYARPHDGLEMTEHFPGGRSMYATNTNETTTYVCKACGTVIVYCGADKTEAAPFWFKKG
jgi:hypothetical protein